MKIAPVLLLTLVACGATPVVGTWEALNVNVAGSKVDLTQTFDATTISSKAVTYVGSTPYFTTVFSGTYTWQNNGADTTVHTSYSSQSITGPNGSIQPLETVCTAKGNCEGYLFKVDQASDTNVCICKHQDLVFQVKGSTMTGTYDDVTVTYQHPPHG